MNDLVCPVCKLNYDTSLDRKEIFTIVSSITNGYEFTCPDCKTALLVEGFEDSTEDADIKGFRDNDYHLVLQQ